MEQLEVLGDIYDKKPVELIVKLVEEFLIDFGE